MSQEQLGLFDTPPDRQQIRFTLVIVTLLFAAFLLTLPVRDIRLVEIAAFIPVIDAVMLLGELIAAALLYAQAIVFRSRALILLATGYVFAALFLIPHALTFPGAFAPDGLLGAGVNTTGWISNFRRMVFPIAIIAYVLRKRAEAAGQRETRPLSASVIVGVLGATALAAAATLLATSGHDLLPTQFVDRSDVIYANAVGIEAGMFALFIVATAMLFRQRSSVLDMWLLVALAAWLIQSLLIMTLQGRFTVGWYCLYSLTLFSHLVVLFALIGESIRLYARLAISTAARDRERDARLMTLEAVTAAISHEVGQPLNAVVLNAGAGLRWLDRATPDLEKAIDALRETIDAGKRTTEVIKSIRAAFSKGPGTAIELDLNDLVRKTAALLDRELAGQKVLLWLALDEALPPVTGDRVQLQRVLVNLFTNAIESLSAARDRTRRIIVRSVPLDGESALLEISDTGIGIAAEDMERIFESFFTTKSTGTGLGLSICRLIVEEHGGRLWASQGEDHGATLHLQLPRSRLSGP